jgi:hypothetical protein
MSAGGIPLSKRHAARDIPPVHVSTAARLRANLLGKEVVNDAGG